MLGHKSKQLKLFKQAEHLQQLALYHKLNKHYVQAIPKLNQAIAIFKQLNELEALRESYDVLGKTYSEIGLDDETLQAHLQLLNINRQLGDEKEIGETYIKIGHAYSNLKVHENAVDAFINALKYFPKIKNHDRIAFLLYHIGNQYNWCDMLAKSEHFLMQSMDFLTEDDSILLAQNKASLGILYYKKQQFTKALGYFNEALSITVEHDYLQLKMQILKSLGICYSNMNHNEKAIKILEKTLTYFEGREGFKATLIYIYENISEMYEKIGQPAKALAYYKKQHEVYKQFVNDKSKLHGQTMQLKYELADALSQKEMAEQASKLKEQFLANISHELRTPINGIAGMTNLLHNTPLNTEQTEYIDAIKTSATNLTTLINDLLDFSKINAGKTDFAVNEFSLPNLLQSVLKLMEFKAAENEVVLQLHPITNSLPEVLIGDALRLNQILLNLVGNAVKFTHQGQVDVSVNMLNKIEEEVVLQFTISDTGIGIANDKLGLIFDSFTQVSSDASRKYEGTGLGLSIVKALVENQGGDIKINSELSKGTTVIFTLPFKTATTTITTEELRPLKQMWKKDVSKINILIVEDNEINRLYAKRIFKQWGFSYTVAENGKVAIEELEKQAFDLVLTDIQMPEMDGYAMASFIRNKMPAPISQIPIIALTARASANEQERFRAVGINDYLSKPFEPEQLQRTLFAYLKEVYEQLPEKPKSEQIDYVFLAHLKDLVKGNVAYMIEFIEIFLKQIPIALKLINQHLEKGNWHELFKEAHKIKSTINILGFSQLHQLAGTLENNAYDKKQLESLPQVYSEFKALALSISKKLNVELVKLQLQEKLNC